jgi:hypothetical protein
MKASGFRIVDCGVDGPRAWEIANKWNERWDSVRRSKQAPPQPVRQTYPIGSLGEAYLRFQGTSAWIEKKKRTREDWHRAWKHIDPDLGRRDPTRVTLEEIDSWYATLLSTIGVRESHRTIKIWRALWRIAAAMQYCDRGSDPSLAIRRKSPQPRSEFWFEGEAVRLIKTAWRMGLKGLASALAVSWDTMLSPVDVRNLTLSQLVQDAGGSLFTLSRSKTGRAAIGTLSKRTTRLLERYVAELGFDLLPGAPIFRTTGGAPGPKGGRRWLPRPYTKETFARDFRIVRNAVFPGDTRKLMDFRRSGAMEAAAGDVDPFALAGKMANTINSNRDLQAAYLPHHATLVRRADSARTKGRSRLRDENSNRSRTKS